MDIISIIEKKKNKMSLTKEEINYVVNSYVSRIVSDAQMSSLLMAICINGMDFLETFYLTDAMVKSGDIIDLSQIDGIKVDKHSTGGVGDKTTLIVAPIVASSGVKVAKLSGRGLGHTGGTIDKLESINNFNSNLSTEEFINQVKKIGIVDAQQTKNIVPADKKIYGLRDVTGTTNSIALIASSIMCKKLASGADKILLDVKTGTGALIPDYNESVKLAKLMVKIGNKYNKQTACYITDMNEPLGNTIGNGLEVQEAIEVLLNKGDKRLTKLCIELSAKMISMGKKISLSSAKKEAIYLLESKKAYEKFKEFVKYQNGDIENIKISDNVDLIYSVDEGYVYDIDEIKLALECLNMGSGRKNKDDKLKLGVGIRKYKSIGSYVKKGELLAKVYYEDVRADENMIRDSFKISSKKKKKNPLIYKVIE